MNLRFLFYALFLFILVNCQSENSAPTLIAGPISDEVAIVKEKKIDVDVDSLNEIEKVFMLWKDTGLNKKVFKQSLFNPETCILNLKQFYGCFKTLKDLAKTIDGSVLDINGLEENKLRGKRKEELGLFAIYQQPNSPGAANPFSQFLSQQTAPPSPEAVSKKNRAKAKQIKDELERVRKVYNESFKSLQKEAKKVAQRKEETIRYYDDNASEIFRRNQEIRKKYYNPKSTTGKTKYSQLTQEEKEAMDTEIKSLFKAFNSYLENEVLAYQKAEYAELNETLIKPLVEKIYGLGTKKYFGISDQFLSQYGEKSEAFAVARILSTYLTYASDGHSAVQPSFDLLLKYKLVSKPQSKVYGLGMMVTLMQHEGKTQVFVRPNDGSLSQAAGIKINDSILEVTQTIEGVKETLVVEELFSQNGSPNQLLNTLVQKLRGPKGQSVTLKMKRWGQDETYEATVTRGPISLLPISFHSNEWLGKKYRIIKLGDFGRGGEGTPLCDSMKKDIETYDSETDGWVLDIQNNGGGLLNEAHCMLDLFAKKGVNLITTGKKAPDADSKWEYVSKNDPSTTKNLVVVINDGSASASEVFSGAIQDLKRGIIVGRTSFGKGSVQLLNIGIHPTLKTWKYFWYDYKVSYKETTARYFLPSGRTPEWVGVTPDLVVQNKPNQPDIFLLREQHMFPLSLESLGEAWKQERPGYVASLKTCTNNQGKASTTWKDQKTPFKKAYPVFYALDTLHCMNQ